MGDLKKQRAFTLAEVLITLAIIGIVASLTIPSLMASYQKVQFVTGLKKSYAEVTEAFRLMANDHGCADDLRCTGVFTGVQLSDDANTRLGNELKKYFKVAKDCGIAYTEGDENANCMPNSYNPYFDSSGSPFSLSSIYYRFITADGFILFLSNYGNCDTNKDPSLTNINSNQVCGDMFIDVNGLKGPNVEGRDLFEFYITNGRGPAIYPYGGNEFRNLGRSWTNSGMPEFCTKNEPYGMYCGARIIEEGWQMNY